MSVSLGSDTRDKTVVARLGDVPVEITRIGTNGDLRQFAAELKQWDGVADAIGLGGMDRFLFAGNRRYEFAQVAHLAALVKKSPVVDGSALKNTLERRAVENLAATNILDFTHYKTLVVCGVDRFGLSQALAEQNGQVRWGDLPFTMGIPYTIRTYAGLERLAQFLLPIVIRLPITWFYPTGAKQTEITPRWGELYQWADIIAGDFLLIRRYLPPSLAGKTVLTNTTTAEDTSLLFQRGVSQIITTTPDFEGRTFGANVLEAVLVALNGGRTLTNADVDHAITQYGWTPHIRTNPGAGKAHVNPV